MMTFVVTQSLFFPPKPLVSQSGMQSCLEALSTARLAAGDALTKRQLLCTGVMHVPGSDLSTC